MFLKNLNNKPKNLDTLFVHRSSYFSICDFAYTSKDDQWAPELTNCISWNPEEVPENSIIFATPWGIEKFLQEIHPRIKNKYILLTLFYGPVFTFKDYVHDPKILAWFGQANSNAITFDKFTLIPLGIMSTPSLFNDREKTSNLLKQCREKPKTNLMYMNFFVHQGQHVTLSERTQVFEMFKDKNWCNTVTLTPEWRMPFEDYMLQSAEHRFVVSPEGDMHDCYRHWDSLLSGSIPIVHTSPLDKIFEDLPVVIIDNYNIITEDFLNQKYNEIKSKNWNMEKLYMKYWFDEINKKKYDHI